MAPVIRQRAPEFKKEAVVDGLFQDISLGDFKGKWVVLAFFPLAFTFVCPTEILAYHAARDQFAERNAVVLFASTDSKYALHAWNRTPVNQGGLGNIALPLIADPSHSLAREYGVFIDEEGVALRGLFLVDPQGVLQQVTINDTPVGRSVDETLRLLDAFQHNKDTGLVCPASWKRGSDAIDPADADRFFKKEKR